ncbi:MAG: Clas8 [Betabaculovirus sp.]|nr:MAG: Clas8 [Betabaculovirus sp.]
MFKIGRAKSLDDVDIVFQVPNTLNSCTQYAYKMLDDSEQNLVEKTRAVSGLDYNRPINCVFSIQQSHSHRSASFVMSMFRAPHLYPDVVERAKLSVIKVVTHYHQEYWYVLGVKKGTELAMSTVYQKMKANHLEYDKLTCYMSGNVPIELVRAFNNKIKNKHYLHSLMITSPAAETNNSTIELIKETNSTA